MSSYRCMLRPTWMLQCGRIYYSGKICPVLKCSEINIETSFSDTQSSDSSFVMFHETKGREISDSIARRGQFGQKYFSMPLKENKYNIWWFWSSLVTSIFTFSFLYFFFFCRIQIRCRSPSFWVIKILYLICRKILHSFRILQPI